MQCFVPGVVPPVHVGAYGHADASMHFGCCGAIST